MSPGVPLQFIDDALACAHDDCIDWPYANTRGYGRVVVDGRERRVNRVVCERTHGPCPPGMEAAHSCGRNSCINPRHLRWSTHRENIADKIGHGTAGRGEAHPRARLSQLDVTMIRDRRAAGEPIASLARDFFISEAHVSRISLGKSWRS